MSSSLNIRPAKPSDLEKIKELNQKLFAKEFNDFDKTLDCNWPQTDKATNYFRERIEGKGGCAFVAEADGLVVGYLVGGLSRESYPRLLEGGLGELENMFVEKEFRSQGLGKKLVDSFIAWCRENKIKRIRVVASAGNELGLNFYHREGFFDWEMILEREIK